MSISSLSTYASAAYNYVQPRAASAISSGLNWSQFIFAGAAASLIGLSAYTWNRYGGSDRQQTEFNPDVQARVAKTYAYILGGLTITGVTAAAAHISGLSLRLLHASPLVTGGTFVLSLGSLLATMLTPKESAVAKHLAWGTFAASLGLSIAPVALLGGALLGQAAIITFGACSVFTLAAFLAPSESFLKFETPLFAALTTITITSSIAAFFPATAFAVLASQASLYGGLVIFCGYMAVDTQRLLTEASDLNARRSFDPINASLNIYLNIMNIFIRVVAILANKESEDKDRSPIRIR
jgi:growth hormone-inducible transmembrane protein